MVVETKFNGMGGASLTIHVLPPLCPQYSEKSENILSFKVESGGDVDFN